MQIIIPLDKAVWNFPDVAAANEDGLLQIGGLVSAEKVLEAYRLGVFPWYSEEDPVLWWSPDPRFVLFPEELHVSRSMSKVFRQTQFQFKTDSAFEQVIENCKNIRRKEQDGTWITEAMTDAYTKLHYMGYAHSAETWKDGELVGGMYGVKIGRVFFGESMFSKETNASKFAFISYVQQLRQAGIGLIDCQVYTSHVESLGGRLLERRKFVQLLRELTADQNLVSR